MSYSRVGVGSLWDAYPECNPLNPFTYTSQGCNAAPPAPAAPSIATGTTGSIYAGTVNGQNVYATPQSAQENMQDYTTALQNFFGGFQPGTSSVTDCTAWYNVLFSSSCSDGSPLLVLAAVAVGVFAVGVMWKG